MPAFTIEVVAAALVIGLLWTAFLFFYMPLVKGRAHRPVAHAKT